MARRSPPPPPEEPTFPDREVAPVEEEEDVQPGAEAFFDEEDGAFNFRARLGGVGFNSPHPERTKLKKQVESTPIAACAVPDAAAWLVEKLNKDTSDIEHVGNAPLDITHRSFIRRFLASMPAEGEESAEFYLTPVDKNGSLLGQPGKRYVTHAVPWDNVILQDIRARMPASSSGESIAMKFLQDQLALQRAEAKEAKERAEAAEERARKAHEAALSERLGHANALKEDVGQAYQAVGRVQQEAFTGLLKTREETAREEREREERREKDREAARKEEAEIRKTEAAERMSALKLEAEAKAKAAQQEAEAKAAAAKQEAADRLAVIKAEAEARMRADEARAQAAINAAKAEAEARAAAAKAEADARAQAAEKAAAERRAEINAEVEKARIAADQERARWEKDRDREDARRREEQDRRERMEAEERKRQDDIRLAREKLESEERARRDTMLASEQARQREFFQQIENARQEGIRAREATDKADRERRDKLDAEEKDRQRAHQAFLETLRTDALKAEQQRITDDRIRQEKAAENEEKRRQEHMQILIAQIEKKAADKEGANPLGVIGTLLDQFGISPGNLPGLIEKIRPFFGGDATGLGATIAAELGKTAREVIKRLPTAEEIAAAQEEEEEEEEEEEAEEPEEPAPRQVEQRNTPPLEDYLATAKAEKAEKSEVVRVEKAEAAPAPVAAAKQALAEERAGRAAALALAARLEGVAVEKWGEAVLGGDDVDVFVRWVSRVGLDAAMEEAEGIDLDALAKALGDLGIFDKGVPRGAPRVVA